MKELLSVLLYLALVVEARRPYAVGHCKRVSQMAVATAEHLNLPKKVCRDLRLAGLLHDIGYIVLPDHLLASAEYLTAAQKETLRSHLSVTIQTLGRVSKLTQVCEMVRYMHHRYDGKGTENELSGEALPIGSRILKIAELFDALTNDRPHRPGLKVDQALDKMNRDQGLLDPRLLKSFVEALRLELPAGKKTTKEIADFKGRVDKLISDVLDGKVAVPSIPKAVVLINQTMQSDDLSIKRLAQVIEMDPSLSLKVIAIGNSPIFAGMSCIQSVNEALVRIGLKETCDLLSTHMYANMFKVKSMVISGVLESWWEHALLCAAACQNVAAFFELPGKSNAYLLGLLHDVGKLCLLRAFIKVCGDNNITEHHLNVLTRKINEQYRLVSAKVLADSGLAPEFIAAVSQPDHEVDMLSSPEAKALSVAHGITKIIVSEASHNIDALHDRFEELGVDISMNGVQIAVQSTLQQYQVTKGVLATVSDEQTVIH